MSEAGVTPALAGRDERASWIRRCANEEQTHEHAAAVALSWQGAATGADRVHLRGPLGAGKTTWVRAALRALGVARPVRSPTYALIEVYDGPRGVPLLHADFYRLSGPGDLEALGLDAYDRAGALWLIEWPERAASMLGPPALELELGFDDGGRRIAARASTDRGRAWLAAARGRFEAAHGNAPET